MDGMSASYIEQKKSVFKTLLRSDQPCFYRPREFYEEHAWWYAF